MPTFRPTSPAIPQLADPPHWLSGRAITALALALALVTLAVAGSFVWWEKRAIEAREQQSVALLARLLEDHANRTFNSLDLTLATLADAVHDSGRSPAHQGPLLLQSASGLPYLRSLSLIDRHGKVLASSAADNLGQVVDLRRVPLPVGGSVDRLGPLLAGRDLGDAAVAAREPPGGHRRNFIPLVRPVPGEGKGEDAATHYLVAVLNPDFFPNEQSLMLAQPNLRAALCSADGTLLGATDGIQQLPGARLDRHRFFTDFLPVRESGAYVGPGIDGTPVVTALRSLRTRPMTVIVESDYEVVQAAVGKIARWAGAVCAVVLLVIAAITGLARRSLRSHAAVQRALAATREDVAASERRLRTLVESVQELIFRTDARGVVVFVNQRWEQISGRPSDSAVGQRLAALCLPMEQAGIEAMFELPAKASVEPVMVRVRTPDGTLRTLEVSVAPVFADDGSLEGFAGFAVDVSERQRARDALQAQLDFTGRLIEASPTPLFVKDLDGRFVMVNRAWLDLMALTDDEVRGRTSKDLYGEEAPKHVDQDRRLLESEEKIRYENRLLRPGRTQRNTVVTKVRFTDAEGRAAGIIGSIVDVTEFHEAERVTAVARDAAERANRAKSEFIANITHELRTPLQAIIGFSDLGGELAREHAELQEMFGDIHAGGRRMLTLVNGLLDLAKMESTGQTLKLRTEDLAALTAAVVRELRPLAEKRRLQIELPEPPQPLRVEVDGFRMQQVIRNVLANALRFAPAGSSIQIDGHDHGADGVELSVRDHGPGIPEDERQTVFEPFVQSSRTRSGAGGTGLGLTICRKIMSAHGGRITAANAADGGAILRIWLPAHAPRAPHPPGAPAAITTPPAIAIDATVTAAN